MPCSSGYDDSYSLRPELDRITRLLCELCKKTNVNKMSEELKIWWTEHQEKDRIREEREQEEKRKLELRKELLNKLTKEELEVLGIRK